MEAPGRCRVIGDEDMVESGGYSGLGDGGDGLGRLDPRRHRMRADGDPEAEVHVSDDRGRGAPAERRCRPRRDA